MSEFTDKVVLITGAGRGLGSKLALEFASRGAILAANELTPINVDAVIDEITHAGGRAKSYLADVAKKVALQTMLTDILEDWGSIDIMINHAKVKPQHPLLDMDEWDWRRTLEVNLTGAFLMMQSVGRVMRELGGGVIVNIAATQKPATQQQMMSAYWSTNAGIIELTRQAASELTPDNIRVNAVCSDTEHHQDAIAEIIKLCLPDDERSGEILKCV